MSATPTSGAGFAGQQDPTDTSSDFNMHTFHVQQMLGRVRTMNLVLVKSVTNTGLLAPVGFLSVQPMVNMLDGNNNATPHGIIQNVPYTRIQGGTGAIILDPVVGDIGWCGFADRDISSVKSSLAIANPGSLRKHDMADAVYIGGILNGTPTQYVRFVLDDNGNPAGMEVVDALGNSIKTSSTGIAWTDLSGNTIVSNSSGITINGVLIDRNQNVSEIANIASSGQSNFGGGGQAVKLADGSNATKVKAT